MQGIFNRAELLLGSDALKRIHESRVILFGVGGVGSWCAEGLIRTGVCHLTIVDSDVVCVSNVNRQLMATTKTIGQDKVKALRERLLEINPDAEIIPVKEQYTEETNDMFRLNEYDFIIDCIDSLKDKVTLLKNATATQARVFSSMGAALKIDATQIRVAEFWKVRGCPLGAALRKKMKRSGIKLSQKVLCVYSEELLENKGTDTCEKEILLFNKVQTNGSLVHVTAIFGFTLSGLVLQSIVNDFT